MEKKSVIKPLGKSESRANDNRRWQMMFIQKKNIRLKTFNGYSKQIQQILLILILS